MPTEIKLLFRPDVLRPRLAAYSLPPTVAAVRPRLVNWSSLLNSPGGGGMKETELLPDFIRDVFVDLLGYLLPASGGPVYTLRREAIIQVDGKWADAALGRFTVAG